MSIITLLLMAVGLSMDAFAVSISSGILLCKARWGQTFKIAGAFGLFQGIMPFIGYTIARLFARQIQAFDHWIAFGLLVFIGGKMLWEVLRGGEDDAPRGDPCGWMNLLVMAVATSIDALAVGVTFAFLRVEIGPAVSCIGVITFLLSAAGVYIGGAFGDRFQGKAELAGGVILVLMGSKILLEHLGFLG